MMTKTQFSELFQKLEQICLFEGNVDFMKDLVSRYPKVFTRIVRSYQDGSFKDVKYFKLPKKKGKLKFEKEESKIRIRYLEPKSKNFSEKFKTMLGEVYTEIQNNETDDFRHRSLMEYAISKDVIDQVESTLKEGI